MTLRSLPDNHAQVDYHATLGEDLVETYARLVVILEEDWDVDVFETDDLDVDGDSVYGFYSFSKRRIGIRRKLSYNMKLETLLHETGHFFAPRVLEGIEPENEVFAEAVAFQVMRELNLPIGSQSLVYLAGLREKWSTIERCRDYYDEVVALLVKELK